MNHDITVTPEDAFEVIQVALQKRIAEIQEGGADAMRSGRYSEARQSLEQLDELTRLLDQVNGFEEQFNHLFPAPREQVDAGRLRKGLKTPQEAYYQAILQSLVELGGSCDAPTVLNRVYDKMHHSLNEHDLALLPSGRDPRWRNTAMWARYQLVQKGLLQSDTSFGVWAISDAGRQWLAKQR